MANYDNYYKTEDLFGKAYSELKDFFKTYTPKGKVLDLGCGQGRDAIALAKLGYDVTGIDNSKLGIKQLLEKSEKDKLNITGIVENIYQFDKFNEFDIIILDSIFHFEKRDKKKETDFIIKIAKSINKDSVICFCIQNTGTKVKTLKETIENSKIDFEVLNDSFLIYNYENKEFGHKSKTEYFMYIIKKK